MKKYIIGLVAGLIMGLTLFNWQPLEGATNIRLIVNGHIINSDVPPMMINGRTMVPARFVAEPLGATVNWDEAMQAVIITTRPTETKQQVPNIKTTIIPPATTTTTSKTSSTTKATTQPKAPLLPTLPTQTLPDEKGDTKSGLTELTNPFTKK